MLSLDLEALEVQESQLSSRWNWKLGCHVCRIQDFFSFRIFLKGKNVWKDDILIRFLVGFLFFSFNNEQFLFSILKMHSLNIK